MSTEGVNVAACRDPASTGSRPDLPTRVGLVEIPDDGGGLGEKAAVRQFKGRGLAPYSRMAATWPEAAIAGATPTTALGLTAQSHGDDLQAALDLLLTVPIGSATVSSGTLSRRRALQK